MFLEMVGKNNTYIFSIFNFQKYKVNTILPPDLKGIVNSVLVANADPGLGVIRQDLVGISNFG